MSVTTTILIVLFWIGFAGSIYSYFLYPLLMMIMPSRRVRLDDAAEEFPSVTFVIAAHNEEKNIRAKIENTLEIDYPKDRFEVLVASDASTDGTGQITSEFENQGVRLVQSPERRGKEYVQSLAIAEAQGDVLVFSDASTSTPKESVQNIVKNFRDPRVGAVSSVDRYLTSDGTVVGEGLYLKYEMWLRQQESRVNTIIGLTGALFGVRRELCDEWDEHVPSDFNTALNCLRHRRIAVSDPSVLCYYPEVKDSSREYQRKLRTIIRGFTAIWRRPDILNPFRFGLAAFQVWSHKLLRWMVPWFMLLLLIVSLFLVDDGLVYQVMLGLQLMFYATAALGLLVPVSRSLAPVRVVYFFAMANLAIAHATLRFCRGHRMTVWQPSKS